MEDGRPRPSGRSSSIIQVNRNPHWSIQIDWVHDSKVISHAALSPGSARRSQKS
jgi:hypothetical protein